MGPSATLAVGYVSRAHGIRGELAVKPFDPGSATLQSVERVELVKKDGTRTTLAVLAARPTPKETLLVLEGVDSREAADALRGATVGVFREDVPPPEPDEFFQGDLVGLTAVDEAGCVLGRVEALWDTGPVPNLVIRKEGSADELVVPFADEFVPSVDVPGGRLVVRPPEYLE